MRRGAVPSGEITTGHCMARDSVTLSLKSGCSGLTTSFSDSRNSNS